MIRETRPDDIISIATHLRAADAVEQFALREPSETPEGDLACDLIAAMPRAILSFCFEGPSGAAATILSAYFRSPGVATLHRLSTDEWPQVSREVFRFGVVNFMPALASAVHRAECAVLADYSDAAEILRRLRFEREGVARARGRNREDFVNFAWVKN